jgi:hypothetical protein
VNDEGDALTVVTAEGALTTVKLITPLLSVIFDRPNGQAIPDQVRRLGVVELLIAVIPALPGKGSDFEDTTEFSEL